MNTRTRRGMLVSCSAVLAAWGMACGADAVVSTPGSLDGGGEQASDASNRPSEDAGEADSGDSGVARRAAAPSFAPPGGTSSSARCVSITTATAGATIHFTTEGSEPTPASTVYTGPIVVAMTTKFRAIAVAPGMAPSVEAVATYSINVKGGPGAPVAASPASGEYDAGIAVTLSTTTVPAAICYTLDGGYPACAQEASPVDVCAPEPPEPAIVACGSTTMTYAGAPIAIAPPLDGGAIVLKARACSGTMPTAASTAVYLFP